MAIFGRSKSKRHSSFQRGENRIHVNVEQAPPKQSSKDDVDTTIDTQDDVMPPRSSQQQQQQQQKTTPTNTQEEVSMEMLPELVQHLSTCTDTSGEIPARALRMLFTLSEKSDCSNRIDMVRNAGGMLVPELLDFLKKCQIASSEQYLALLVLNNVCIPSENKRLVALDCGGAQVLSRLLCLDPSCHLMSIILVNLTFCDAELRKELVTRHNVELIPSLSFALRVACMTQDEYEVRQPLTVPNEYKQYTPSDLLHAVIQEDSYYNNFELVLDQMLYPETARWCLSALKNLSRPSKDSPAAHVLVRCGIVPHILQFLAIGGQTGLYPGDLQAIETSYEVEEPETSFHESSNAPSTWQSNSIQDASLFVIMNLAAVKASREHILELNGVETLTRITEYDKQSSNTESTDEHKQLEFQRLKARMALAYLVASEGNFGQPRRRASSIVYNDNFDDSMIVMTEAEVFALLELLTDSLQQRSKSGAGGFSAATFNVKWVLYAIRCLVTHTLNQIQIVTVAGVRLNVLLIKVLALYALGNSPSIDADAAEYAAFTLYLLSNRGFTAPFLPGSYGTEDRIAGTGSLAAKILTSYIHMGSITPAGRHAADQLLLRLRYLSFIGSVSELTSNTDNSRILQTDYILDESLIQAAEAIIVENRKHGARPRDDIFDRPILRSKAPKRGTHQAPWENGAAITTYPNALVAVQSLSFGSTKVRHLDAIDDVLIANNIANSANGEKTTESYNYWWAWQDADDIHQRFARLRQESSAMFGVFPSMNQDASFSGEGDFPFSFFGCGNLCGTDTSG